MNLPGISAFGLLRPTPGRAAARIVSRNPAQARA